MCDHQRCLQEGRVAVGGSVSYRKTPRTPVSRKHFGLKLDFSTAAGDSLCTTCSDLLCITSGISPSSPAAFPFGPKVWKCWPQHLWNGRISIPFPWRRWEALKSLLRATTSLSSDGKSHRNTVSTKPSTGQEPSWVISMGNPGGVISRDLQRVTGALRNSRYLTPTRTANLGPDTTYLLTRTNLNQSVTVEVKVEN